LGGGPGGRRPFGGLGGVGNRAGAFDLDPEALKRANAELAKLNKIGEPDFEEEKKEEAPDNRSMMQVMQDKRRATEAANAAALANQPQPAGETMEERKARLAAQRDLLRKMKEEKRLKELNEFNARLDEGGAAPSKNLAEEFKQMDANKQLPSSSNPEMDRRRMIYKNIRKEISETEKAEK
jgi:acyl-CoA reductase-like NAD-dependent aldehyde dehydrogenase